jgi:predicted metalloprotease
MMRRTLVAVLVLGLVAVSCGDDGIQAVFPTAGVDSTTRPTTPPERDGYPEAVVDEYVRGCTTEATESFCRCTIEEIEQRLSLSEFVALADADLESDPVVGDVIDICLGRGIDEDRPITSDTTEPPTGEDFVPITDIQTVTDLTIQDLELWWSDELPAVFGVPYESLTSYGPYFVSQGDVPDCGGPLRREEFIENAFYCSLNDTVRWDAENLMGPLFQEFGDFTVALVLAHEWGHAIQARYGFDDFTNPTIVSELQADCLAGSWTGRVAREESDLLRLEPGDLEEGMAGFLLIGDQLGTNPGGSNAHGGSFDRLNAFFEGFNSGTTECATYEDDRPDVVFIPLRIGEDPVEGGDLPFAETAPLLSDALDAFWAIAYPEIFQAPWVPVTDRIPYLPSSGEFPACGGQTLDAAFYEGNAFYCPSDDYVAWDDEVLFPSLYTEIGDFAIGLILANEWGRAVQQRAGLPLDGADAQLQVDCLAGVWTAALIPEDNPTGILLSAGDLEEGIAGFLTLSSIPSTDDDVGAFDRFEAFKEGFFDGAEACDL